MDLPSTASRADVLHVFETPPPHVHVVVTGRNAPAELVTLAAAVTEMTLVEHPFTIRRNAELGVDFR